MSVVARNSRIDGMLLSWPNNCTIEVFRAICSPPVALPISRQMIACWSFHRWQRWNRCRQVCGTRSSSTTNICRPQPVQPWLDRFRCGPCSIGTGRISKRLFSVYWRPKNPDAAASGGDSSFTQARYRCHFFSNVHGFWLCRRTNKRIPDFGLTEIMATIAMPS
jgi:hypothetical protein